MIYVISHRSFEVRTFGSNYEIKIVKSFFIWTRLCINYSFYRRRRAYEEEENIFTVINFHWNSICFLAIPLIWWEIIAHHVTWNKLLNSRLLIGLMDHYQTLSDKYFVNRSREVSKKIWAVLMSKLNNLQQKIKQKLVNLRFKLANISSFLFCCFFLCRFFDETRRRWAWTKLITTWIIYKS